MQVQVGWSKTPVAIYRTLDRIQISRPHVSLYCILLFYWKCMLLKSKLCTIKTNISLTYSISRLTLPALRVNNVQSSKAFFMSLLSGICIKIVIFSFLNIKLYSHVEYAYLNFVHPSKEAEIFISIMCIVLNISVIYNGTACLRPSML